MVETIKVEIIFSLEADLLSNVEWDILVFDHVCNLTPHCKDKENNPITKQYRPKDRNIKYGKESHDKCYAESLCHGVPAITIKQKKYYIHTYIPIH